MKTNDIDEVLKEVKEETQKQTEKIESEKKAKAAKKKAARRTGKPVGRPKKIITPEEVEKQLEEAATKRKVGRPPKNPTPQLKITYDEFMTRYGYRLIKNGYSDHTVVNRAKEAVGPAWDGKKHMDYLLQKKPRNVFEKIESIWKSQV